tara:strand:+ start:7038 stop:7940 length:903 start_codon:yes stop_codon:yes gene_type:complete
MKKILVIIGGPTCTGKSEISIKLAKKFNSEIISSDSRQFYKELNIGVAKLPEKKLKEVKHHLINNKSIVNNYSIGDYQSDFYKVSKKIFKNKDLIFLCGGSGLYIDAVCKGFNKIPEINLKIRNSLNNDLKIKGLKNLTERLKKYDIKSWEKIDLKNPRKVIRCLEVYYSTNKPISSFYNEKLQEKEFECLYFSLNTKREFLYENINNRVEKMIAQGLENEVRSLIKFKNSKPLQSIGYTEFFEYFENKNSLENTISKIKQNTRRYAKRQITWFKSKKYLQVDISKIDLIEKIIKQKRGN